MEISRQAAPVGDRRTSSRVVASKPVFATRSTHKILWSHRPGAHRTPQPSLRTLRAGDSSPLAFASVELSKTELSSIGHLAARGGMGRANHPHVFTIICKSGLKIKMNFRQFGRSALRAPACPPVPSRICPKSKCRPRDPIHESETTPTAGVLRRSWPQAALILSPLRWRNLTVKPARSRISRKRRTDAAPGVR